MSWQSDGARADESTRRGKPGNDAAVRVMTDDGAFRIIALRTTDLAQGVVTAQGLSGREAQLVAELLTGAVLVRETMAPDFRVELMLQCGEGSERVTVVADSHNGGMTRGYVSRSQGGSIGLSGSKALLRVVRRLPRGRQHESIVGVDPDAGVSGALMEYMQASEQVTSTVVVGARVAGSDIIDAGGYIVQLLPECGQGPLMVMTERLQDFQDLAPWFEGRRADVDWLANEIAFGMPSTVLERPDVFYGCTCSEARVLGALASIGRSDLEEMVQRGEVIPMTCEYCKRTYEVGPTRLSTLFDAN